MTQKTLEKKTKKELIDQLLHMSQQNLIQDSMIKALRKEPNRIGFSLIKDVDLQKYKKIERIVDELKEEHKKELSDLNEDIDELKKDLEISQNDFMNT